MTGAFGRLVRHNTQKSTASLKKATGLRLYTLGMQSTLSGRLRPPSSMLIVNPVAEFLVSGRTMDVLPPPDGVGAVENSTMSTASHVVDSLRPFFRADQS